MLVSEKGVTIRYVVWVGAIQLKEKKNGLIIEPRKAGRELKKKQEMHQHHTQCCGAA